MTKRDLHWLRRRTTVEDLLDDRVENNSDIALLLSRPEASEPYDPEVVRKQSETLARARAEQAAQQDRVRRKSISWFGVALGLFIAASGTTVVIFPVEMQVEHRRIMYLPTVWEHVTPARARLYGFYGIAFGIFLVAYSLHRPRLQ